MLKKNTCFLMRWMALMVNTFITLILPDIWLWPKLAASFPTPISVCPKHWFVCFFLSCGSSHKFELTPTILFLCGNLYLLWWIVHIMGLFMCIWVLLLRLSDFTGPSLSKDFHSLKSKVYSSCDYLPRLPKTYKMHGIVLVVMTLVSM